MIYFPLIYSLPPPSLPSPSSSPVGDLFPPALDRLLPTHHPTVVENRGVKIARQIRTISRIQELIEADPVPGTVHDEKTAPLHCCFSQYVPIPPPLSDELALALVSMRLTRYQVLYAIVNRGNYPLCTAVSHNIPPTIVPSNELALGQVDGRLVPLSLSLSLYFHSPYIHSLYNHSPS